MVTRNDLALCKLNEAEYLLPFGQAIADHIPGMQVNETASLLYRWIREGADVEELIRLLCSAYQAKESDLPLLRQDIDGFLALLRAQGQLLPDNASYLCPYESPCYLKIGPLTLSILSPGELIASYFSDFLLSPKESACVGLVDQSVKLLPYAPSNSMLGNILLRTRELLIAENGDRYLFLPQTTSRVYEMHVTKDASEVLLFVNEPETPAALEDCFHMLRFAYLLLARNRDLYAVHSASLLYRDRAWLFSGSAGTGKSTHTGLWAAQFGTPLLNGDLNLIGMEGESAVCYGLPWCGTSGIHTARTYPLGGIVFLKKAPADRVFIPTSDRQALLLLQRMVSLPLTEAMLTDAISFCERILPQIHIFRLECTKEPSAAQLMKSEIDASCME